MAPSVWKELSTLPSGDKLVDRYGRVTARWADAMRVAATPTWVLDRKGFRAELARELPPAHDVIDVAGDRATERRASRAARAYERTLGAARELSLPEWGNARRLLVWTSPVIRPRGVELPLLVQSLEVTASAEAVREAIGRLWAVVYFDECLRTVRTLGLRRVELATGLSVLEGDGVSPAPKAAREVFAVAEPVRAVAPLPGRFDTQGAEGAFSLSLGAADAAAFGRALGARFRRVPAELAHRGPGRWELDVQKLAHFVQTRSRGERRALECLLGESEGLGGLSGPVPEASRWALSRTVGREVFRQSTLADRVQAFERRVTDAVAALTELDLAVLPDDGLKRTLEDAARLWRESAELGAEALLSSELLVASSEELDPEGGLRVDAGHEGLAWLGYLSAWQERLEVVRHDAGCREALLGGVPLPEGAGRRALLEAERHYASWAPSLLAPGVESPGGARAEPSAWVRSLALLGLRRGRSVSLACREARFEADRQLALNEEAHGSLLALSLSAVRSLTRDAVALREQVRVGRLRLFGLLSRITLDVDRRLRRIEPSLPVGGAFDCTFVELVDAVDLRGTSLVARVLWRRAERERQVERHLPWWSALASEPRPEEGGAVTQSASPLSLGEVSGPALVAPWDGANEVPREPVLVVRAFSAALLLALPYVRGFVVERGARSDSFAVVARALGVPGLSIHEAPRNTPTLAVDACRVMLRAGSRGASVRWQVRDAPPRGDQSP